MNDREGYVAVDRGAGRGTTAVAWIALLLSLLALALAFTAFSRTSDIDNRIREGAQDAGQSVERGTQDATDAVDAGPDGVDEDDTDTGTGGGTTPTDPAPAPTSPDTTQ